MQSSLLKFIFRLLLGIIVAILAGALFGQVLPASAVWAVVVVVACAEFLGGVVGQHGGAGSSARLMVRMGATVAAWPLTALVLSYVIENRDVRIGLAAAVASIVGMGAAKNGSGRDSARLLTVIIAVAIPAYAALMAVLSGDRWAMVAACVAVAVAPLTALLAWVWPDAHHEKLLAASGLAAVAGCAVVLRAFVS